MGVDGKATFQVRPLPPSFGEGYLISPTLTVKRNHGCFLETVFFYFQAITERKIEEKKLDEMVSFTF